MPVEDRQAVGRVDVQQDGTEQADSQDPQHDRSRGQRHQQLTQELAVVVDVLRPEIHLEVADHVGEDVAHQGDATECHRVLLADRGAVEVEKEKLPSLPAGGCGARDGASRGDCLCHHPSTVLAQGENDEVSGNCQRFARYLPKSLHSPRLPTKCCPPVGRARESRRMTGVITDCCRRRLPRLHPQRRRMDRALAVRRGCSARHRCRPLPRQGCPGVRRGNTEDEGDRQGDPGGCLGVSPSSVQDDRRHLGAAGDHRLPHLDGDQEARMERQRR